MIEETEQKLMRIGEVSKLVGIADSKLRLYDKEGVLVPSVRDPETGYRYYTQEDVRRLERVLLLRRFEVSLADIKAALDTDALDTILVSRIDRLKEEIDKKSAQLDLACTLRDTGTLAHMEDATPEETAFFEELLDIRSIAHTLDTTESARKELGDDGQTLWDHLEPQLTALCKLWENGAAAGSEEVQQLIGEIAGQMSHSLMLIVMRTAAQFFRSENALTNAVNIQLGEGASAFLAKAAEDYLSEGD